MPRILDHSPGHWDFDFFLFFFLISRICFYLILLQSVQVRSELLAVPPYPYPYPHLLAWVLNRMGILFSCPGQLCSRLVHKKLEIFLDKDSLFGSGLFFSSLFFSPSYFEAPFYLLLLKGSTCCNLPAFAAATCSTLGRVWDGCSQRGLPLLLLLSSSYSLRIVCLASLTDIPHQPSHLQSIYLPTLSFCFFFCICM